MKLDEMRKAKNMTQAELAKRTGVAQNTISQLETGERRPSVEVAKRIAGVLGFDWTRFYEDERSESA